MSYSTSDSFSPKDSGILARSACLHCSRRKTCPYSCDHIFTKSLQRAACQGRASAQLLTAEAERLLQTVSQADTLSELRRADEALKYTLSNILRTEITASW